MAGFILDFEAIRTASRLYLTQASLEEYESQKIEEWGRDVEASSHVKLSLPLLTRDEETHYISVNFDPALVRLLRETKYFLLAELQVPESALAIYAQVETFRVWTQKLDMVVMKHNGPRFRVLSSSYFINTTRVHRTMPGVVSLLILTEMLRAGRGLHGRALLQARG